jgi:hypothetical protein
MRTVEMVALLLGPRARVTSRPDGRRPRTHDDHTGRAGSGSDLAPADGGRTAHDDRVSVGDNALSVRVEDVAGLAWDDGSTDAARRL